MLLQSFKEKFHFPACFVEVADGGGIHIKAIGDEDKFLSRVRFPVTDAAEFPSVNRLWALTQSPFLVDDLVTKNASCPVGGKAFYDFEAVISLLSCNEEDAGFIEFAKPRGAPVSPVHHGGGTSGKLEMLSCHRNVVATAFGDDKKLWQVSCQINRGVKLYRPLSSSITGPGAKR